MSIKSNNIRILNDKFNTDTGVYTCKICFVEDNNLENTQKMFIKEHVKRLNYSSFEYIFDQSSGSKVQTFRNKKNKNEISLEVHFVKNKMKIQFEKCLNDLNSNCFPVFCNERVGVRMCVRDSPSPPPYVRED